MFTANLAFLIAAPRPFNDCWRTLGALLFTSIWLDQSTSIRDSSEILRNGNWNDLWRLCHGEVVPVVMSQGIFECLDAEARLHRDRQSPCQKPAAEPVEHDRQIDEAAGHRGIRVLGVTRQVFRCHTEGKR